VALQSISVRQLAFGKEAGVIFTVLVVLWLGSQGDLDPASLLLIYLISIAMTGLYFGIQSLDRE
jgi:hypothetical protein